MGRGRKGFVTQSRKKMKPDISIKTKREEWVGTRNKQISVSIKINFNEEAVEVLKHMNPERLVNFLLPNDDCYVKDSTGNASGS